jgi:dTMP kinase
VTFEGGEGAGKSTQIALLASALRERGVPFIETREPGGTPAGEAIRALIMGEAAPDLSPLAQALLHSAARVQHVENRIDPALREGKAVLCDRFADSTLAYQGYGMGLDQTELMALIRIGTRNRDPDMTFILDLPVELGLSRARSQQYYEKLATDFHERVREGFLEIARHEPDRCVVIDATQTTAEVHRQIRQSVFDRLDLP